MTDDNQLEPDAGLETTPVAAPAVAASAPDAPDAAGPPSAPAAPKKKWTRYLTPALALVAALVVGGLAGVLIGQNTAHPSPQRAAFTQGAGGFRGGQGSGSGQGGTNRAPVAGGFTAGTITAIHGDVLTLKLPDGSTVKVTTSGSTKVTQTKASSVSKLKTGDAVTVIGPKDASGVRATTIAEGRIGLGGIRGGQRSAAPGSGN